MTPYHAKLWATLLSLRGGEHASDRLAHSLASARVDLNPHQVAAAVFAMQTLRLGGPRGALLADEVGLGKTIEAGLVLAQLWSEGRRRLLLVVPAMLRKQWQAELAEKFGLQAVVVDSAALRHQANNRPTPKDDRIWIVSYHLAARSAGELAKRGWDLAILDEAHRMRGTTRGATMATAIAGLLGNTPRLLLTATPLQNNLMELHSLAQLLDPHLFGDTESFRQQFVKQPQEHLRNALLRERLQGVCVRTLRRQVQEYVRFTRRIAHTQAFAPTDDEHALYEDVSEWLRRPESVALPPGQRPLLTMVLRKLLASSTLAIAGALRRIIARVEAETGIARHAPEADEPILADFEGGADLTEALGEAASTTSEPKAPDQQQEARIELALLRSFADRAETMARNTKAEALLLALGTALKQAQGLGAANKAVVFTESRRTQGYLRRVLEAAGYPVICISGGGRDPNAQAVYRAWLQRHRDDGAVSGVKSADLRAALVEYFRDEAVVLLATEAAAEGVNLQFCSLVVNYDLPWNPQRVEQRIGRCHRYGQKHDVVVVNFLNQRNAADLRVLQLLTDKFLLFDGVFGCSDEVLGAVGNGVDLEARIAAIYQGCRTEAEIHAQFNELQDSLRPLIDHRLAETREQILSHFDEVVQDRLRVHRDQAKQMLDRRQRWLLDLLRFELGAKHRAAFQSDQPALTVLAPPHAGRYHLDWRKAAELGAHHLGEDHPLATDCIAAAVARPLASGELHLALPGGANAGRWLGLAGQAGVWTAAMISAEGLGGDDALFTVWLTDQGEVLDGDVAERMWQLPAEASQSQRPVDPHLQAQLQNALSEAADQQREVLRKQRAELLDQEADKLGRWAEDEKLALKLHLERLDQEISDVQRQVRQVQRLEEKLELRRRERELDRQRTDLRRSLFDAQDRVDAERGRLLDALEAVVSGEVRVQTVMTGRWRVG